ncbi:MAG TPA: hypothetical protein VIM71_14780, partial [Lacunisphaera sp.]
SSAWWHIHHGALNPDEGFYAIATRAVAQGEVPYRDFGFTQPPLLLYANSMPLRAIGFGLFQQRFINGIWAMAALVLAAVWLARHTRPAWGVAFVGFAAMSSPWMYFIHLGKTYGFTCLLVMLGAWAFLEMAEGRRRNLVLGLFAALGIASRLPAAPYFGLLAVLACWSGRPSLFGNIGACAAGLALGLGVLALPFWLVAPDAVRFWVFDFHHVSVPLKTWHLRWQEIATLAPAAWLLGLTGFAATLRQRRPSDRTLGVFAAACVALAVNLLPGGVYEEYAVPFLLPLVVAAAALLHEPGKLFRPAYGYGLIVVLAATQLLTAPLLFRDVLPQRKGTLSMWLPYNAPAYNRDLPRQLAAARKIVAEAAPENDSFVGSNLILAAETGRPVAAELRMGPFAFTKDMPFERAAHLHLATATQLDRWFDDPRTGTLAFFPNSLLNYNWSMPSFGLLPDEIRAARYARVLQQYDVRFAEGDFVVLVRKPGINPCSGSTISAEKQTE